MESATFKNVLKLIYNKIVSLLKAFLANFVKEPLHLMTHPIQGYMEFKEDKKGKFSVAMAMVLIYSLLVIIAYNANGIIINNNDPTKFNSIRLLVYTIMPIIVLTVANWSITTLLDGKGTMKQIFTMGGYAYFPLVISQLIVIILSNVLTVDEVQMITMINIIGYILCFYMVFMGLIVIHEYGVAKSVLTIILTIVATAVILFIALLIFDLASQIYGFLYSLYKEIVSRFF